MKGRWRTVTLAVLLSGAAVLAYRGCASLVYNEANKPAGLALAAAIEAYHAEHRRFPALVPRHLAALPQPARLTIIAYRPFPDGTQCWIAYTVHRDYFDEYDCRLRAWHTREYEETEAIKEGAQLLKGPMSS